MRVLLLDEFQWIKITRGLLVDIGRRVKLVKNFIKVLIAFLSGSLNISLYLGNLPVNAVGRVLAFELLQE